jgi:hypothetical protein
MLIDERTYVLRPGCLRAYLARHVEVALPLMREHLGEPLAYFAGADGEINTFVHLWLYADAADRETRRGRLYADARWRRYREATSEHGWVLEQRNRLLSSLPEAGRVRELAGWQQS